MIAPRHHAISGALLLLALPLSIALIAVDARARRRHEGEGRARLELALVRLPSSDLALSGGARWLRSISTEEPWAAFADGPAIPDPDPAGGVVSPPAEVWGQHVQDAHISHGPRPAP